MYNIQCLAGHVFVAPLGSELEKRCIKQEAQGFLDALCVSEKECPECQDDQREHLRRELRLCEDIGCPMGPDDCKDGCMVVTQFNALPA